MLGRVKAGANSIWPPVNGAITPCSKRGWPQPVYRSFHRGPEHGGRQGVEVVGVRQQQDRGDSLELGATAGRSGEQLARRDLESRLARARAALPPPPRAERRARQHVTTSRGPPSRGRRRR